MKAVNLLPSDYKQVRQTSIGSGLGKHTVALGGIAGGIVVAAVLGLSYQSATKSAKASQASLDALNARIAAVSQPVNSTDQSVRDRIEQVTSADATRMSWDGFMTNMAKVLPEDVWLNAMNIQEPVAGTLAPAATPGVAPTGFTMSGYTYSQASVARLMRRLSLLPWLSDVTLQNSTVTTLGAHSVFQFTIVGAVNALPAKEAS
jgi:Tfp pilus assembly protein PilN